MAVSESSDRLEDLIHLLRTLSEGEIAAVQIFAEGLAQREVAVREAQAAYVVPARTAEKVVRFYERDHLAMPRLANPEELLDFLAFGPPGFLPGELDRLLSDVEHTREMELEIPSLGCTG